MKSFLKLLAFIVVLNACGCVAPQNTYRPQNAYPEQNGYRQETAVSFQLFYDELSPYGSWVQYPNYGYVWFPRAEPDFAPYCTNGHWVATEAGWAWVSGYQWGWAAFHYGRWAYDDAYGWFWVPHNEWAPAWVTWRRSEGYYGWAPMGPNVSVELAIGREYRVPDERWTFVRDRDFDRPDIDRRYVDRSTNVTIINNTTVINNTYVDASRHTTYVSGPNRDDVRRATGTPVRPVSIQDNDKPGQTLLDDRLQVFRPNVQATGNVNRNPAPQRVENLKDVRRTFGRDPGGRGNDSPPAPPQNNRPPADQGVREQPGIFHPPDRNKSNEQQPPNPNGDPNGRDGSEQSRRIFTKPDPNVSKDQPPETRDTRPTDSKGREQPWVGNPPDKNKNVGQQPETGIRRTPGLLGQAPQRATPPKNAKDRQAQPTKLNQPKKNAKKSLRELLKPPEPQKKEKDDPKNQQQ